jgi:hypothetical protein
MIAFDGWSMTDDSLTACQLRGIIQLNNVPAVMAVPTGPFRLMDIVF